MRSRGVNRYLFFIGLAVLVLSFIVPSDILNSYGALRPIGLSTVFICPVLGMVGIVLSIINKDWIYIFLNLLLILSFPIVMLVGNAILN